MSFERVHSGIKVSYDLIISARNTSSRPKLRLKLSPIAFYRICMHLNLILLFFNLYLSFILTVNKILVVLHCLVLNIFSSTTYALICLSSVSEYNLYCIHVYIFFNQRFPAFYVLAIDMVKAYVIYTALFWHSSLQKANETFFLSFSRLWIYSCCSFIGTSSSSIHFYLNSPHFKNFARIEFFWD